MTYQEKNTLPPSTNLILLALLFLFALAMAFSCSSEKAVLRKADKLDKKRPQTMAKWASKNFPPIIKYKQGKTDTIAGDTITVDCDSAFYIPENINPVLPVITNFRKPVTLKTQILQPRIIRVPLPPYFNRIDTLMVADSAALKVALLEVKKLSSTVKVFRTSTLIFLASTLLFLIMLLIKNK